MAKHRQTNDKSNCAFRDRVVTMELYFLRLLMASRLSFNELLHTTKLLISTTSHPS